MSLIAFVNLKKTTKQNHSGSAKNIQQGHPCLSLFLVRNSKCVTV